MVVGNQRFRRLFLGPLCDLFLHEFVTAEPFWDLTAKIAESAKFFSNLCVLFAHCD
jgi:hypothetical protein